VRHSICFTEFNNITDNIFSKICNPARIYLRLLQLTEGLDQLNAIIESDKLLGALRLHNIFPKKFLVHRSISNRMIAMIDLNHQINPKNKLK
jgi:hypothetical protein